MSASLRSMARKAGVSHVTLLLWMRGERRLAPETEARVHAVIAAEQARIHRVERAQRLGETVIAARAADGV